MKEKKRAKRTNREKKSAHHRHEKSDKMRAQIDELIQLLFEEYPLPEKKEVSSIKKPASPADKNSIKQDTDED